MKANHNRIAERPKTFWAVSNGSKILKWKQITTQCDMCSLSCGCFQWFKDTKMKANHNTKSTWVCPKGAVSNGSKILKWKQITTKEMGLHTWCGCFQWFKDTKMKANHNWKLQAKYFVFAVSNGSKILKWKQITTYELLTYRQTELFPMVQRYRNSLTYG